MNSRERVLKALNFEEPDRVPIDFWMSNGFKKKLESTLNVSSQTLLDSYDVDLRYIEGPEYIGPSLPAFSDGWVDIWGVRRETVTIPLSDGTEIYHEVRESPLASATTVEEIEDYAHWPSVDWFEFDGIEAQCAAIRDQGRVAVFMGDRLNRVAQLKPAMYLRGVEQIFIDMARNSALAEAILTHIRRFYRSYAKRIFEAANGKLDVLLTGDDFGSQQGPFVSPRMWIDFLGEGFAEYIAIAKEHGLIVMHHTCGSVRQLIPLFIERGLDVLQSLQPEASDMNLAEIKAEFGDCLAFHGGISIQRTMPFGSPHDVRNNVRAATQALAAGGGYVFCTAHNIQADTPVQNAIALLEAYHEYGSYT